MSFFDVLSGHVPGKGRVCAHRGARSLGPENTLFAFEKAERLGADFIEFDVRLTGDGELAVFHDEDLARTTDAPARPAFAVRRPWNPRDFSLAELQALDAGSWFLTSDPFGTVASGELSPLEYGAVRSQRIPSLREVLGFFRKRGLPFNLEIKDMTGVPGGERIVAKVLDALRETGCQELALLSSFNHGYIAEGKRLAPEIPWGVLIQGDAPEDPAALVRSLGADAYHPPRDLCPPELAAKLARTGIPVNVWTVNDPKEAAAYLERGASAVITDFPHRIRRN